MRKIVNYYELDFNGLIRNKDSDLKVYLMSEEIDSQEINMLLFKEFINIFYKNKIANPIKENKAYIDFNDMSGFSNFMYIIEKDKIYLKRKNRYEINEDDEDYKEIFFINGGDIFNFINDTIDKNILFSNIYFYIDISNNLNKVFELLDKPRSNEILYKVRIHKEGKRSVIYNVNNETLLYIMEKYDRINKIDEKEYKKRLVKRGFL